MRKPPASLLALCALSAVAALGCHDDPPTPTEVRSSITGDLGNVLRETSAAVDGSTDALPGSTALSMIDRILGSDSPISAPLQEMTARLAVHAAVADPGATGATIDADAQVAYFNDKLFTDANHVGDGVYQVPASLVCTRTAFDGTTEVQTIDPKCAAQLAKAELRIRVARDGGALVFAVQLDADHDEPLLLTLTHTSLAVTVDLDGAQRAFVALAAVFDEDVPNVALGGRVTGKLEVLGTAKVKLSASIDRALSIKSAAAGTDLAGPGAFVLASAKATVVAVTLDGHARSGALAIGLGETAVKLPAASDGKRFELDLPGVTASAAYSDGRPLAVTHLGLGGRTTVVSISGVRAQTIDLNPDHGRALDVMLSRDPVTGTETVAVTPRLDLRMTVDHAVLGDSPPVYDVTRVLLDGSLRGDDANDRVQVTGSFSIATNPASFGVTAITGQCVTGTDATDPTTGQPFTRWTAGSCN
jgi:hypothetical protein